MGSDDPLVILLQAAHQGGHKVGKKLHGRSIKGVVRFLDSKNLLVSHVPYVNGQEINDTTKKVQEGDHFALRRRVRF